MNYTFFKTLSAVLLFINLSVQAAEIRFLTIADIHYGNPNETGAVLWQSTLKQYQKLAAESDFILFLGDMSAHAIRSARKKADIQSLIFHDLYRNNTLHKPLFFIAGNNDSLAGNYMPFSGYSNPLLQAPEWSGGACAHCDNLTVDTTYMFQGGYYSSYVVPGRKDILLIVINATQFAEMPWWKAGYPHQNKDAEKQLKWLENQLKSHSANQLLIAMHEEPGKDYLGRPVWKPVFLKKFISLLDKYQKQYQEISLLAAHSHYDELRKIQLKNTVVYSYSSPSISHDHHNYSAMKLFQLSENGRLKNFTTFYSKKNKTWSDGHYSAIPDIFPACHSEGLADCLSLLTAKEICRMEQDKHVFGAGNPAVKDIGCETGFAVSMY